MRALTCDEVGAVDRRAIDEFGMPGVVLMENAGRGTAELLMELGITGRVVICCGKGNNGGDGFVIARHLENRGHGVQVLFFGDPQRLVGDALVNFTILTHARTPLTVHSGEADSAGLASEFAGADWIVDALLGTGMKGDVREPFRTVIHAINQSPAKVLSVDVPSGLDCDSGQPLGCCVRADHTATFVARKTGFDANDSGGWLGEVHVIEIGVPHRLLQSMLRDSDTAG